MPEMRFHVRWPDGSERGFYSPSLVVTDHLEVDGTYTVADLRQRSTTALHEASERVMAKYGFACTASMASLADLTRTAEAFADDEQVTVTRFDR